MMSDLSGGFAPQQNDERLSLDIDSSSPSNAMINPANTSASTVDQSPITSHSSGPPSSHFTSSASAVQARDTAASHCDLPSDLAHSGERAMLEARSDNQQRKLNPMAIDFILNSDSTGHTSEGNDTSTQPPIEGNDNGTTKQTESCKCSLSHWTLGRLEIFDSTIQKQIGTHKESINKVLASASDRAPANMNDSLPYESEFTLVMGLSEEKVTTVRNLRARLRDAKRESVHIFQHAEKREEAEAKAKKKPMKFIVSGSKSTIYDIPESFGSFVLKVGSLPHINQERLNHRRVTQAQENIPTGWVAHSVPGLLRPSKDLDPRIQVFYKQDGDRIAIDNDERADGTTGIVMSRIKDLEETTRRKILQNYCNIEQSQVEEVLSLNDHCLVRVLLGRRFDDDDDDEESDDAMESVSGNAVDDDVEMASVDTSDCEPPSLLNIPGYLDFILHACKKVRDGPEALAKQIAFGYALLHWGARLDGRGIEFLLGLAPLGRGKRLYMLDFEACRPLDRSDRVHLWKVFVKHYLEASAKIWEASDKDFDSTLPETFIRELERNFLEQNENGSEHGGREQDGENEANSQQDSEDGGNDEDDPAQADREASENNDYGSDEYNPNSTDSEDSSEEEDSDDDDDDDCPLPPAKPILKKSASSDTSTTPPKARSETSPRKVTFWRNLPSYKMEKPANAPYWKRGRARQPILLGFH
ncbi:exodeoxyribonuclease [Diaporthe amygdali]|uniref:exodeoxyribonuclease n=1 Tax=Phomopsis amygdali TaxID=1214568 RepID=UPI0022FE9003|nr:exodeoxyribonuclease [Diaporthe amygdali]KAJ0109717.1 exodeoxyribonuclease [Diaporthe amygdali]